MSDKPIIFAGSMVRAILEGRKRQTRRVTTLKGLRWAKGDRLYVRERGWISKQEQLFQFFPFVGNEERSALPRAHGTPWKAVPSIHMPRYCSRLTLIVTDVRVERLQDISEDDARAEGAKRHVPCKSAVAGTTVASDSWHYDQDDTGRLYEGRTARDAFEILWGKINGWKSWDANPWVAVISFDVVKANIDTIHA